jgi:hypothetical protein
MVARRLRLAGGQWWGPCGQNVSVGRSHHWLCPTRGRPAFVVPQCCARSARARLRTWRGDRRYSLRCAGFHTRPSHRPHYRITRDCPPQGCIERAHCSDGEQSGQPHRRIQSTAGSLGSRASRTSEIATSRFNLAPAIALKYSRFRRAAWRVLQSPARLHSVDQSDARSRDRPARALSHHVPRHRLPAMRSASQPP